MTARFVRQILSSAWARALRLGRLGVYVLSIQVLLCVLLVPLAKAKMESAFGQVGAELLKFDGARYATGPRALVLNGARLIVRSGSTERPLEEVLDHFEAVCRNRGGFDVDAATLGRLESATANSPPARRLLDGVWRSGEGRRGFVACLDMGNKQSLQDIAQRLAAFARSGDLKDVGDLRMVQAEESGGKTAMLGIWTEGPVPLNAMFPKDGDCPGQDHPDLPRPTGAHRVLSTWEEGAPRSLTTYRSPNTSVEVLDRHYRSTLPERGWAVAWSSPPSPEQTALVARRGAEAVLVMLTRDAGGTAYASIGPM